MTRRAPCGFCSRPPASPTRPSTTRGVELLGKPIAECSALCIPTANHAQPGGASHTWQFFSGREPRTPRHLVPVGMFVRPELHLQRRHRHLLPCDRLQRRGPTGEAGQYRPHVAFPIDALEDNESLATMVGRRVTPRSGPGPAWTTGACDRPKREFFPIPRNLRWNIRNSTDAQPRPT